MKLVNLFVFIFYVSSIVLAADSKVVIPKYVDYPADSTYEGKAADVIIESESEKMFETNIEWAAKQSPNFAGKYSVVTWGCGGDCISGAIVNLKTGNVTFFPGTICCWAGEGNQRLHFRMDSRLIIFEGVINERGKHGAHFYKIIDSELVFIKTIPVVRIPYEERE